MIPKVSAALSRLLKPIGQMSAVNKLNKFTKTSKDRDSSGSLPYESFKKENQQKEEQKKEQTQFAENPKDNKVPSKKPEITKSTVDKLTDTSKIPDPLQALKEEEAPKNHIPFQAGLTQVILELKSESQKNIKTAQSGTQYEQTGGPRANKGAMLDKKVG